MPRPSHPRVYKTEAVVLKRVDLGEADRIVTIYTPRLGKLRVVAKGVRKTTSRMAGHLELLTRTSLLLAVGTNLDLITQAQAIDSHPTLRADLERISCGLHVVELVDQLTPDRLEAYPIYELLTWALDALSQDVDRDLVLRFFELQILTLTGFRPQLHECVRCHQPIAPGAHGFSPHLGGVICRACVPGQEDLRVLSLNALKVLRFIQSARWAEARRLRLSPAIAHETSMALREYLRFVIEHDLRSVKLLDSVRSRSLGLRPRSPAGPEPATVAANDPRAVPPERDNNPEDSPGRARP